MIYEINIEEIPEEEKKVFEHFLNKKWGHRIKKEQKIIRSIMITAKTSAIKTLNKEIVNLENRIKELKQIKSQLQEMIPCEMIY